MGVKKDFDFDQSCRKRDLGSFFTGLKTESYLTKFSKSFYNLHDTLMKEQTD